MLRDIVKIDENLCDGCALCIPNCHEGALQIIDEKAVLISDLMCDGLGACIGHCPQGAITIEKREAEAYDEVKVMAEMVTKGKNTVVAHLKHLKEHNETAFLKEGVRYLHENEGSLPFSVFEILQEVHNEPSDAEDDHACASGGCPGSRPINFADKIKAPVIEGMPAIDARSELSHWPIQLHLINPVAGNFRGSDLLIAADCSAFSMGAFHSKFIKGKTLVIACPKLDDGQDIYMDKIQKLIDVAQVNTITVTIMEVPCCGGLLQIVNGALRNAGRKVPVKAVVIGVQGEILREEWV